MNEEKKSELDTVTIKNEILRKYFPRNYTPRQMESIIIKLLDQWQMKKQLVSKIFTKIKDPELGLTVQSALNALLPASSVLLVAFSNLRLSTLKNHLSTLQVLCQYQPQVSFDDLTFNFLCGFEHFLLEQKYHRNTIAKYMSI